MVWSYAEEGCGVCQEKMEPQGRSRRGRPKRRLMDVVMEDMRVVGVEEEDAEDRAKWRRMIRCGDP